MSSNKKRIFRLAEILETQDISSVLKQATILLGLMVLISGMLYLFSRDTDWSIPLRDSIVGLSIGLVIIQLIKAKYNLLAAYLALILFGGWLIKTAWDGVGIRGPSYAMLILIVIGSGLFIGKRAVYLTALIISLTGVGLLQAGRHGLLTNMNRPASDTWVLIAMTITFFTAAHMLRVLLNQVDRALGKAQNEIKERVAAETALLNLNARLESMVEARTFEVRANERRFRALFERSNDAVSLVGLDGKYITVNQKGLDLLGFTADEMRSKSVTEMPITTEQADGAHKFANLLAGKDLPVYERRVRTRGGRELTVEVDATLVRDDNGDPSHVQMISHDITERKQIELEREKIIAELEHKNIEIETRASEISLFYKLSNSLAAGDDLNATLQMLWNEINQLIPADAFYVAIYDDKTDMVRYPIFFYMGTITTDHSDRILKDDPGLTGAVVYEKKTIYLPNMFSREVVDAFAPVDNNEYDLSTFLGVPLFSRERIIGMLSVQTQKEDAYSPEQIRLVENIALQAALAIDKAYLFDQLQHELGEKENLIHKLENINTELERFTYTVSHDLKAPLVTIRGFLGYLEKDIQSGNPQRIKSDMERIVRSTDKMQTLLEGLLKLSRAGRTIDHLETASLETIVRDAVSLLEGQINEKGVQVEVADRLPEIYGDPARLIQVLQNLIDNAVKFMSDQKNPRIEIGQREDDAEGNPVFFVSDNGMGIAPEYLGRVFGLFDKLDSQAEGTGIGLATVKRIIETHGGKIWVESEGLGKGSTFCFTIPDGRK